MPSLVETYRVDDAQVMLIVAVGNSVFSKGYVNELQPELLITEPENDALPAQASVSDEPGGPGS